MPTTEGHGLTEQQIEAALAAELDDAEPRRDLWPSIEASLREIHGSGTEWTMPPVIAVVGDSDSGKTTVGAHLVDRLAGAGYRVAAVKHCPHGHEVDRFRSDTDRYREAGAVRVVAISPGRRTSVDSLEGEQTLEEFVACLGRDIDVVIAEGFKSSAVPKVLVTRSGKPTLPLNNLIATVGEPVGDGTLPSFDPQDLDGLVALIQGALPSPGELRPSVSLAVDGEVIPLSRFASSALAGVVEGYLASLKGVPDHPREIRLTVRWVFERPEALKVTPDDPQSPHTTRRV